VAAAPAGAAAASEPASAGEAAGGSAERAPSPRPAELAEVRELAPGATYRIGQAVRSGDLTVALLDGRAGGGGVEARFLSHNAGPEEAIVSPGRPHGASGYGKIVRVDHIARRGGPALDSDKKVTVDITYCVP
jgi:hypothetical protein